MEVKGASSNDSKASAGTSAGEGNLAPPAQGDAAPGRIRKVLTSESFVEKVAVLLLTVLFTSLLVPLAINYFSSKAAEREKAIEARKARDASILQAQAKLLDEAAETILTYETLALDVSWYKDSRAANEEMYLKAVNRYGERMVDLVAKWRALISRSRTLASPSVSEKLDKFLTRIFTEQDTPISSLVRKKADASEWKEMHEKSKQMLAEANDLIAELASDMNLSRDHLHR
jgi:hypothetical protein